VLLRPGRAGVERLPPRHRTAARMAEELHALLHSAGIAPPYVLAGHSLGGLVARVFIHLYPGEVAGLALIDASHPEMSERQPKTHLREYPGAPCSRSHASGHARSGCGAWPAILVWPRQPTWTGQRTAGPTPPNCSRESTNRTALPARAARPARAHSAWAALAAPLLRAAPDDLAPQSAPQGTPDHRP